MVVTSNPSSDSAQPPVNQNAVLEARVTELEDKLTNHGKKRKSTALSNGAPLVDGVSKRLAATQREMAANAEISRLKLELATLKAEGCPGYLAQERKRAAGCSILPKRALSLAGYWNVLPNDLLNITPALIASVEAKGGTVLRREGLQTCFRGKERRLVVEAVLEIMPLQLPHYQRREEEG